LLLNFLQLLLPFSQIHDFLLGSSENLRLYLLFCDKKRSFKAVRFVREVSEVSGEIEPVRLMSTIDMGLLLCSLS
ncbi:unnamed protein product, partial [Arabidopsis halleri]